MMSLLINLFIKDNDNLSAPSVKKAYAELSSTVGIILNILLCVSKILIGSLSNSISICADGFNNLSDAGTALVSLFGFKIAKYGGGTVHPFGHGRIEWIMGIFTSITVIFVGFRLAASSVRAITDPEHLIFSPALIAVLVLSILVKGYMYCYNRRFSKITDSESLKATAADCISDSIATMVVLFSTVTSHFFHLEIDGYTGILVSVFIMFVGIKSLWEVLGRVMGKAADQNTVDFILQNISEYPAIISVHNLMLHDYGFGYFVISMKVSGYKKDYEQLYKDINEISHTLYTKFRCDCFIQIDYLIDDVELAASLESKINHLIQSYSHDIFINNLRLIECGHDTNIAFDLVYPADLQKQELKICRDIEDMLGKENQHFYTTIKGKIRRERFSLPRIRQ